MNSFAGKKFTLLELKSENCMLLTQPAFQFWIYFNYISIQIMVRLLKKFHSSKNCACALSK